MIPSVVYSGLAVKQPETLPAAHVEDRRGNNAEKWKLAMARTCEKRFSPECEVHLQHCFVTLWAAEDRTGERPGLRRAASSAPCGTSSAANKRQWEIGGGVLPSERCRGTHVLT